MGEWPLLGDRGGHLGEGLHVCVDRLIGVRHGACSGALRSAPEDPDADMRIMSRRSAARMDCAQPGQPGCCALAFVVADELIDRPEVDRGGEVNRVERSQGGFFERAGRS